MHCHTRLATRVIEPAMFQAVCNAQQTTGFISTLCVQSAVCDLSSTSLPGRTGADWAIYQWSDDPEFRDIIAHLELGDSRDNSQSISKVWQRHLPQLLIRNEVLYWKRTGDGHVHVKSQLVLPEESKKEALKASHDLTDHPGRDRTYNVLQKRFF